MVAAHFTAVLVPLQLVLAFLLALLLVLRELLGNRVEHEAELHFSTRTSGQRQVLPDLIVLSLEFELPAETERGKKGRIVQLDEGYPRRNW